MLRVGPAQFFQHGLNDAYSVLGSGHQQDTGRRVKFQTECRGTPRGVQLPRRPDRADDIVDRLMLEITGELKGLHLGELALVRFIGVHFSQSEDRRLTGVHSPAWGENVTTRLEDAVQCKSQCRRVCVANRKGRQLDREIRFLADDVKLFSLPLLPIAAINADAGPPGKSTLIELAKCGAGSRVAVD